MSHLCLSAILRPFPQTEVSASAIRDVRKECKQADSLTTAMSGDITPTILYKREGSPDRAILLTAFFFKRFFWLCPLPSRIGSAVRRIFFSAALGLMRLSLGSVCFGFFVPLAFLLCLCRLRTLFTDHACLNFAFQCVNPLFFSFVFSTFRWRQTPEYLILPSLVLVFAESLQLGIRLFLCHRASSFLRGE